MFLSTGNPKTDTYPVGGGTQYEIQGLAESLAALGHDIHIIARAIDADGWNSKGIHYVRVVPRGRDPILSVMDFGLRAINHIREIDPDILYLSERFSAAFASRLPLTKVFALHNSDGVRPYWRFALGYNPANLVIFPFKNRLEEKVMRRCHRVIVPTQSWLEYLAANEIKGGVAISHGLRMEQYENRGDNGFLIYAGRLNRVKGVDVLLRAFAEANFGSRCDLLLAGGGPQEPEFRRMARKLEVLDRVKFLGHVPWHQLLPLYAVCTAVILPSRWETFGIAAAEGLACGKAVVASDIPGPRDFIVHRKSGLLFPAGNSSALARLLREVIEDPRLCHRLGLEARRQAERLFDFQNIASEHERLYQGILQGEGRNT